MGPRERVRHQRPRADLHRGPGGLREGQPLTDSPSSTAAAPDPGAAAARLSAHHAWLRFVVTENPLPQDLGTDARDWQESLGGLYARWYDGVSPPAVAAVFVLQWLLQVPAHTAAFGAALGPWRVRDLGGLTFTLGPTLVPRSVRLTDVDLAPGGTAERLAAAETDYRAVADPLAERFPAHVRLGPHTRTGLVEDMWAGARADAEAAATGTGPRIPDRVTCCLIYALPGCRECAGCPRIRRDARAK